MTPPVPLAAIQYRPPKGRPAQARQALRALVSEAVEAGAKVIVAPEMATTGYVWPDPEAIRPHCEPALGPTFEALSPLAAKAGAWILCGFAEQAPDGLYNSALVIDPSGALHDCYRKVLLFPADERWAGRGLRHAAYEGDFGRLAPCICMDLNDDLFAVHLLRTEPSVVGFCTNWIAEPDEDMVPYWRYRMAGWKGWFVAANTWGVDEDTRFYGRSTILGPRGEVVRQAAHEGDCVLVTPEEEAL